MSFDLTAALAAVSAGDSVRLRAEKLVAFFENATGKSPQDAFISEYVAVSDTETQRVFESLFFIVDDSIYEAKNFLHEVKLDCVKLGAFHYWEISVEHFDDLKTATEDSRFHLSLQTTSFGYTATLQASGANCARLASCFLRYIRPQVGL